MEKEKNTPKHSHCSHAFAVDVSGVIGRQIRYAILPFHKEHLLPPFLFCWILVVFGFFFSKKVTSFGNGNNTLSYYLRALYMKSPLKTLCHSSISCKSGLLPNTFKIQHLYSSVSVSNLHINCDYTLLEVFWINSFVQGK